MDKSLQFLDLFVCYSLYSVDATIFLHSKACFRPFSNLSLLQSKFTTYKAEGYNLFVTI
jgi:hypothetical protein